MKKTNAAIFVIMMVLAIVLVSGCVSGENSANAQSLGSSTGTNTEGGTITVVPTITVEYKEADLDTGWDDTGSTYIELTGNSATIDGSGATVDGSTITVTSAGTYVISGTLQDGQIIVNAGDDDKVKLVLNCAEISCSASAPIYVISADKTVITLAGGTYNSIADGDSYIVDEEGEPNAAIFSKDDLTINGDGTLVLDANYNNGIQSKDDLKITGGTIVVNAVNDGIKGKDSVAIRDGTITITAGGDGIQSTNDGDSEKGYVAIEGGTIDIIAGTDGIQAETVVEISGGEITISSGGGSANGSTRNAWGNWGTTTADSESESAKGIKGLTAVIISGGTIDIDSSDDSVHSNNAITMTGGTITISSGDDGMHSDSILTINNGDITITKSYEGLESGTIIINGGDMHITASDDGINVAGGNDGSSVNGRPGQNEFVAGDYHLYINGGYIVIDAGGDGLDSNGTMEMTGGIAIVNGPTNNGNGPLDYQGSFTMTGGYLLAVGSSGMAQAPGTSSTQNSVMITYSSSQAAGTLVHIESENGEDILTFAPAKTYQSVVLCSGELAEGATYTVYSGGSSTGTVTDGLYSGGTYTPGTEMTTFTISGTVTYAGSGNAGQFGMAQGMQPGNTGGLEMNRTAMGPGTGRFGMNRTEMGEFEPMGDMGQFAPPDGSAQPMMMDPSMTGEPPGGDFPGEMPV